MWPTAQVAVILVGCNPPIKLHRPVRTCDDGPEDEGGAMRVQVHFGRMLRRLRDDRGMTQVIVADGGGFDRAYVADLEAGKVHPSLGTFMRIADALDIPPVALMQELVKEIDADPHYELEQKRPRRGSPKPKRDEPKDIP